MTDPMAALDAAYARVQQAEKLAEEIVNGAWLDFGRAIREARDQGTKQADIARHFDREPEHIRRIQEDADVADGIKPPPARKTRPGGLKSIEFRVGEAPNVVSIKLTGDPARLAAVLERWENENGSTSQG